MNDQNTPRQALHVLHLARVVLEAQTTLSVSTGLTEDTFDTQLVRDANGLPALPGTAVAGVLRHLWLDTHDESANTLFGYQDKDEGAPSRLSVSWGVLLDSRGRPAEGLLIGGDSARLEDEIYEAALAQIDVPVTRDRVRLTHRGAAAGRGKFDRAILPAGHRFALELRLWSKEKDDADWPRLLGLFAHPLFRLGGATRAGLGAMRLVSVHARGFDLKQEADIAAFRELPRGLTDYAGLEDLTEDIQKARASVAGIRTGTLSLTALGLWRIGQGEEPLDTRNAKAADLLPKTEEKVSWNDQGEASRRLRMCLLPGSSLKGALAHRMAFHYRRLAGQWADDQEGEPADKRPAAIDALLGAVKNKASEGKAHGRAGALYIDDAWIEIDSDKVARLVHNAIDRFTGGVRDRVLYEEESLYEGSLVVRFKLDERRLERNLEALDIRGEAARLREALRLALEDLCQGRLALGSRTTTGNGFFKGELKGSLQDWLTPAPQAKEAA